MKLHEIFDGDHHDISAEREREFRAWIQSHTDDPPFGGATISLNTGLVMPNDNGSSFIQFVGKAQSEVFDPPFGPNDYTDHAIRSLCLQGFKITDLSRIPPLERLILEYADIKSFNGAHWIDTLTIRDSTVESFDSIVALEVETIEFSGNNQLESTGVLKLLKNIHLKKILVHATETHTELGKVMKIVGSHLKDKNIPDCMDELIEAGLKEYAKL
jgi:hypothetical protein